MTTYNSADRYALRALLGTNVISDIDAGFLALRDDVSAKLTPYSAGLLASRPVSTAGSPGIAGRHYYATDTGVEYLDLGTAWHDPTTFAALAGDLLSTAQTAGNRVLAQKLLAADANVAYALLGNGAQQWGGGGASAVDTFMGRVAAGQIGFGNLTGISAGVSNALLAAITSGNDIEFGHSNPAGFRSTLGSNTSSGAPFIALSAEAGTTGNTFRTRGIAGSIITTDVAGTLLLGGVPLASADNQAFVKNISVTGTLLGLYGAAAVAKTTGYGAGSQVVAGTKGALTASSTLNDVLTNLSSLITDLRILGLIGA